jgi:rhodanese-related sulfurtransferase
MVSISVYRKLLMLVVVAGLSCGFTPASAVEKSAVKEKWHTPYDLYLSPQEAHDMKAANPDSVLMIDVRTRAEAQFVGFTDMADANIPIYLFSDEWKLKKDGVHGAYRKIYNDDFVKAVDTFISSKSKDKSAPIILMCQSGGRSPVAARSLHDAGYKEVYFQVEGFEGLKVKQGPDKGKRNLNGWKKAGLPWNLYLKTEKMYFNFAPKP